MAEGLAVSTRRGVKRNLVTAAEVSKVEEAGDDQEQSKHTPKSRKVRKTPVKEDNLYQSHAYAKRYTSNGEQVYKGEVCYPHPSIVTVSTEEVEEADSLHVDMVGSTQTCSKGGCTEDHHHCPLCPSDLPSHNSKEEMQRHFLKVHTTNSFRYTGCVIVLCNLPCEQHLPSHYHCPGCGCKTVRTLHMRSHLERCSAPPAASSENQHAEEPPSRKRGRPRNQKPKTPSSKRGMRTEHAYDTLWGRDNDNVKTSPHDTQNRPVTAEHAEVTEINTDQPNISDEPKTQHIILPSDLDTKKPIQLLKIPGQDQYILIKHSNTSSQGNEEVADLTTAHEHGIQLEPEEIQEIQVLSEMTEDQDSSNYLQVLSDVQEVIAAEARVEYASNSEDAEAVPGGTATELVNIGGDATELSDDGSHIQRTDANARALETQQTQHDTGQSSAEKLNGIDNGGTETAADFRSLLEDADNEETNCTSHLLPHVSIVRRVEDINCYRCQTCCSLFHCPLCPKDLYKPMIAKKLQKHVRSHFKCAVKYQDVTSMKCNLPCSSELGSKMGKAHWHCPLCPQKKLHRSRLREHLNNHSMGKTRAMPLFRGLGCNFGTPKDEDTTVNDMDQTGDICDLNGDSSDVINMGTEYEEEDAPNKVSSHATCTAHTIMEPPEDSEDYMDNQAESTCEKVHDIEDNVSVTKIEASVSDTHVEEHDDSLFQSSDIPVMASDSAEPNCDPIIADEIAMSDRIDSQEEQDEENGTTVKKPCAMAFQLVAGLLSEESISTLGALVGPLISRLGELTGVVVTQEDPVANSYMLQGTWDSLDKTRIIVETMCDRQPVTEEDMENTLIHIYKVHPDKFPGQDLVHASPEESAPVDDIDSVKDWQEPNTQVADAAEEKEIPLINHEQPCPYCLKTFRYRLSLFTHLILRHKLTKKPAHSVDLWRPVLKRMNAVVEPECPSCGKQFKNLLHAKIHYGTFVCTDSSVKFKDANRPVCNPENGLYECKMCDYVTKTQSVMLQHMDYKHKEKTLQCEKCDKMFSTERILLTHVKSVHEKKVACQVCFKFIKSSKIQKHLSTHNSTYLSKEMQRDGKTMIKCFKCDYCTSNSQLLNRHLKRAHLEQTKTCDSCNLEFPTLEEFQEHMKTAHDEQMQVGEPRDHCPICFKTMLKRNVMAHVRLKHQGVRRYKCPTCNKMFQTKYVLDSHKQTHLLPSQRKYRYVCSQCNMGFLTKTIHEDHITTHSNMRPFLCTICGSTFRLRNVYIRHMATHADVKYNCEFCQNIYKTKYSLQQHLKKHAQNKDKILFICVCGQTFNSQENLQHHAKQCLGAASKDLSMDQAENVQNISVLTHSNHAEEAAIPIQRETNDVTMEIEAMEHDNPVFIIKQQAGEHTLTIPEELLTVIQADPSHVNTDNTTIQHDGSFVRILPDVQLKQEEAPTQLLVTEITPGGTSEDGMAEQRQDPFLCGYCNMLFDDLDLVQTHIITDHKDQIPQDANELQMTMQQ